MSRCRETENFLQILNDPRPEVCKFVRPLESFPATWLDFPLFIVLARLNASLILCDFKIPASNFKRFRLTALTFDAPLWTGFAWKRASEIRYVKTSSTRILFKSAARNSYKSTNWLVRKLTAIIRMKNNDRRKTSKRISNAIDYLVIRCIEIP